MISVPLSQVRELAAVRPAGYFDDVLASGRVVGDAVEIDDDTHAALVRKYRPTLLAMGLNLAESMAAWTRAGFPLTPQAVYDARRVTCAACPHYDSDAWIHHCSRCGCSGVKLHLMTEKCPDDPPRW